MANENTTFLLVSLNLKYYQKEIWSNTSVSYNKQKHL